MLIQYINQIVNASDIFTGRLLKLNNNGLGVRGGTLIGKALLAAANKNTSEGRKSSLRTIIAGRNRLENGSSQALANAIAAHGTLTEVRIPQNGIRSDGIITWSKGLAACKDLEILDLQDNTFTETGSVAFSKALVEWPNLKVLNVGDCLLSTKGGMAFAKSLLLGHNTKLETLNLQYNEIDGDVVKVLATTISTHLKNLSSLELNGNKVDPEDISIKNVKSALEENGYPDALGELDDMEISDEEDEEDEEEELEESDAEEVEKLAEKEKREEELEEDTTQPVSKRLEKLHVKELEDGEDLVESKFESQLETRKPEKSSTNSVEDREINKDQEIPSANIDNQLEVLTERLSKV